MSSTGRETSPCYVGVEEDLAPMGCASSMPTWPLPACAGPAHPAACRCGPAAIALAWDSRHRKQRSARGPRPGP
jgi:hypothetical protein